MSMLRFRLIALAFAVAVLVPVVILVDRALESVALERDLRHRTLAERVFDEMERGLSRLLEEEESRPLPGAGPATSTGDPPFVLGRYESGPGGTVHAAGRLDDAAEITRLVRETGRDDRASLGERLETKRRSIAQSPGTTVELAAKKEGFEAAPVRGNEERDESAEAQSLTAYDAFRSLNKALVERNQRQQKLGAVAPSEEGRKPEVALAESEALADVAPAAKPPGPAVTDFSPMIGRAVDRGRFVLQRTVVRSSELVRQGVVLDVSGLGEWLRELALGTEELARHGSVSFATPLEPARIDDAAGDAYVYRHRFGEPFADVSARLALLPLPGSTSVGYVHALSALLAVTLVVGLIAIDRMVSARVAFAERRSNFVAAVSHELKTPLTAIRMYGEMLRDGMVASPDKRAEYYRHITAESERLSRLINNVLELSRLEKGERPLSLANAPIGPAIEEAAALVRPHVEAQGFELRATVDRALPPVRLERDALTQMLFNLVDNAVKYAGGGREPRIDLSVFSENGGVVVVVRDHGPGVDSRHLGRIFEAFYRGENELTRRSRGTGIGLALVRGLAERMGARANARNAPDGGLEVRITFPTTEALTRASRSR